MTSIVQSNSFPSSPSPNSQSSLVLRNNFLSSEVIHLHKIIALKDATLEEIRKYINQLASNNGKQIESFSIVEKSLQDAAREEGGEKVRRSLSYEISQEIDQNIAESMERIHDEFNAIFERHKVAIKILSKDFDAFSKQQQQTKELSYKLDRVLVEVPVEVSAMKEAATQATQVDLFQSPKNSERNEERSEFQQIRLEEVEEQARNIMIKQLPEEMLEVQEVPAELILKQGSQGQIVEKPNPLNVQVQQLKDQITLLSSQNCTLKRQIQSHSHDDHPYYFQIEITTPEIAVPFDNTVDEIELPIEFVISNDGHSETHFEIVEQSEEVMSKAMPSRQPSEWSPQGKMDQATRSEIESPSEEVVGIRNILRQVKEESIILENAHKDDENPNLQEKQPILIEKKTDQQPLKLHAQQNIRYVQVYVQKIVQVPVQLVIEKIKYIEVPISRVQQVQVFRLWPVEVYVDRIVEVPVEVVLEKETIVEVETVIRETNEIVIKQIHEVTIEKNTIYEVPVEIQVIPEEKIPEEEQPIDVIPKVEANPQAEKGDFQAQEVQLYFDNEFNNHQLVIEIPQEMMVERTVEKTVYVDRVVEVPIEVFVQRIVEVPVQVIKIVEVPVQVAAEPKTIYVYVPYVVEVPLELNTSPSLIEVPIQMEMQPVIYEIPVDVTHTVEIFEVPVEMQEPPLIYEVPVEMNMLPESPEVPAKLQSKPEGVTKVGSSHEEVFTIPMHKVDEITIEHNNYSMNRSRREIVVQIPVEVMTPQLIEIPIQLDISDQTRRNMQLRYREKVDDLNSRYQEEIKSLLEVVESLQRIIVESTHEREHLTEELEGKALLEEQLNKQLIEAELTVSQANEERQRLQAELSQQNRRNRELLQDLNQMVSSPPIVYQLPVELNLRSESCNQQTQTNQQVIPPPSVIEVAVECEVIQRISESQLKSDKHFKYFKGYTEEEVQEKLREIAVKPELIDRGAQTQKDTIDLTQFDIKTQLLHQGVDNAQMVDYTQYMRPDLDQSTQKQVNLISGIQCAQDYEHFIDEIKIYEYALEVIPEPIIYEVPVDLKVFKESMVSEVQTEDVRGEGDRGNVRLAQKRRTEEVWIQTDERQDIIEGYSAFAVSRIIEIPIQLAIQQNKEAASIHIQTQQYMEEHKAIKTQPPTSQDFRKSSNIPSKLKLSKFDIVQLIPLRPSEVVRLQSASYSLADQFANQSLTIDNIPSLPFGETQRLYDVDSKFLSDSHDLREALVIITSHHHQHKERHDVILEENEAERSRVQVNIDELDDLNFQEGRELHHERNRSEIKQNYSELYENAVGEVEKYKLRLEEQMQTNVVATHQLQRVINDHQEKVKELKDELAKLERKVETQETTIEEQRVYIQQSSQAKAKLERKIQHLIQEYEKAKEYNLSLEESSSKEMERLKSIINDKIYEIKELKTEQYQMKELYETEIQQLRAKVLQKKAIINELQDENQRKANKIQQLYDYQQDLRKSVVYIRQNSQSSAAALYQQEFIRIKDDFEETRKRLEEKLKVSNEDNQQLREEIAVEVAKYQQVTEEANELDHSLGKLQQEYLELKNLKAELECSYLEGVKELQSELQELQDLLREKDDIIQELQLKPGKLNTGNNPQDTPPRMQYLSRKLSRQCQTQHLTYTKKLETLLVRYQKMLANNQVTIQELQEKVCQYLRDALQKQHEAQLLYSKLIEYQSTMNNILVQKITLQIQNKRMSKSLQLSQRKILILGNKLIQAAGKRQVHESSDEDYYYQ